MSRLEEYEALRSEGLTQKEIAERCGVTRQAVAQFLARKGNQFKPYSSDRVIFDGLREWLNEHRVSVSELIRQYYGRNQNGYARQKMLAMLRGRRIDKDGIDFFLNLTGMTYEQLFCNQGDN